MFWITDRSGTVSVLKIMPDAPPEAAGHLRELDAVLARLRDRGYPAPRFRIIGQVPGLVFWVQPRLPGAVLDRGQREPDHAALARLLSPERVHRSIGLNCSLSFRSVRCQIAANP